VTGVTLISSEITSKRMQLLRDLNSRIRALGILVNPANPGTEAELTFAQRVAATLWWQLKIVKASNSGDLHVAFEKPVARPGGRAFGNHRSSKADATTSCRWPQEMGWQQCIRCASIRKQAD
jgi:putative tryptophan/tyrosine transport system substrate-binding protein